MTTTQHHLRLLCGLALPVLLTGCPSPDAAGKYDRFNLQTEDDRVPEEMPDLGGPIVPDTDGDTDTDGPAYPDITGTHLVAVSTVVDASKPLQFLADVTFDVDPVGDGTISVVFQPLSLDVGSSTEPREEVGDAIEITADVVGGAFTLAFGETTVTGEANPITGSDIVSDISLEGVVRDENSWCGNTLGEVLSPIMVPLDGSTFGAIRLADRDERPTDFPVACL